MKLKKVLSAVLALTTLSISTASTVGTAYAVEVETKDTPQPSSVALSKAISADDEPLSHDQIYDYNLCDNVKDGVILHAWCWSFNEIAANMEKIAAAGYTAVQTSPASECYKYYYDPEDPTQQASRKLMGDTVTEYGKIGNFTGVKGSNDAWWWHYQPVDFTIGNYQLGTLGDYKKMCAKAHQYGVKIITDVVANHTATDYSQVSDTLLSAVGIPTNPRPEASSSEWYKLYHKNWNTPQTLGSGRVYDTYYNMECEANNVGLRDLNTENPALQKYILDYLNDLIDAGCDGFRYDAVKHVAISSDTDQPAEWQNGWTDNFWNVMTGDSSVTYNNENYSLKNTTVLGKSLFIYGEALALSASQYEEYGRLMGLAADSYGYDIRKAISYRQFGTNDVVKENWSFGTDLNASGYNGIVTWVESHDTYCNDHKSAALSDWEIKMAWAAVAARAQGTPLFYNRPKNSDGSNDDYWGDNTIGRSGNDQYFDEEVAAVNKFHNKMIAICAAKEKIYNINDCERILQIDRYKSGGDSGTCGTCIINLTGNDYYIDTVTNMAPGTYVDTVSGNLFTVVNKNNKNYISGHIMAGKIATIYGSQNINLSSSRDSCEFVDESIDVTLTSTGANSTYTIKVGDNQTTHSFVNGATVNIGADVDVSDESKEITLILKAERNDGTIVSRYYSYTKRSENDINYIYFNKNGSCNWSSIYAYLYAEDRNGYTVKNANWPGMAFEYDSSTGYYKYLVPYNLEQSIVIFHDNTNNKIEEGYTINNQSMIYDFSASTWTMYNSSSTQGSTDNGDIADQDSDLNTYKYVYFFNSMGWDSNNITATLKNSSGTTRTHNMTFSNDLHCYYIKYGVSNNYNKITFSGTDKDGNAIEVSSNSLKAGMMFVPTTALGAGEWTSLNNIIEHTIYFGGDGTSWYANNYVNIFMWNGDFINKKYPGEAMTCTKESNGNTDTYDFSYTYYYPKLEKNDDRNYVNVIFSCGSNQTVDLSIPTSTEDYVYKFTRGSLKSGTNYIYNASRKKLGSKDNLKVSIDYTNYKVADMTGNNSSESLTTTCVASVKNGNISPAVALACYNMGMTNVYDNFTFYNGSQFNYVKEIAATVDSRISSTEPRAAYLNPANLAKKGTAFSGINDDSSNLINELNNLSNNCWVNYYNGNNSIEYSEINSDLSNLTEVRVTAFNMTKNYKVLLHYPTLDNQTAEITFGNGLYTNSSIAAVYTNCKYNQLLEEATNDIKSDLKVPDNMVFDGWYIMNIGNNNNVSSYLKISSEMEYKYRITDTVDLYAVFRGKSSTPPNPQSTAIANSVDVFSETVNNEPTTMYRYNTLFNICNCNDNDSNIKQVGIVYIKLDKDQEYGDLATLKNQVLNEVKNANFPTTTSKSGTITINNAETPYSYYNYKVGNGNSNKTVKLTAKNRMQFILKLKETQATEGSYQNVLAFTVYKYGSEWNISENCIRYDPTLNDKYETIMITN